MSKPQHRSDKHLNAILDTIGERTRLGMDDTTDRLAYADWLEDNSNGTKGDPNYDRATVIRLQLEASELPANDPKRKELAQQAGELINEHTEWTQPLLDLGVKTVDWERGFPAKISIDVKDLAKNGELLLQATPTITELDIFAAPPHHDQHVNATTYTSIAGNPRLSQISSISLQYYQEGDCSMLVNALASSPHVDNLKTLDLGHTFVNREALATLGGSKSLSSLKSLNISAADTNDDGMKQFLESDVVRGLNKLELPYMDAFLDAKKVLMSGKLSGQMQLTIHPNPTDTILSFLPSEAPWQGTVVDYQSKEKSSGYVARFANKPKSNSDLPPL